MGGLLSSYHHLTLEDALLEYILQEPWYTNLATLKTNMYFASGSYEEYVLNIGGPVALKQRIHNNGRYTILRLKDVQPYSNYNECFDKIDWKCIAPQANNREQAYAICKESFGIAPFVVLIFESY